MNRRGQVENPVILFAIILVSLIIFAPISLKVYKSIQEPLSNSLANISNGGAVAAANFNAVMNPLITLWDQVMTAAFIFSLLILFVSAFLVDTHPFWVILYVFTCLFLVVFTPNLIATADQIYDNPSFSSEVSQLTFLDYVRLHYAELLLGVIFITGVIMYGKVALTNGGGGR